MIYGKEKQFSKLFQKYPFHLGLIHTCDFLGMNYCVNFSVHTIAKNITLPQTSFAGGKNGYITHY